MSHIDIGSLANAMLAAVEKVLKVHWNDVRPFADQVLAQAVNTAAGFAIL